MIYSKLAYAIAFSAGVLANPANAAAAAGKATGTTGSNGGTGLTLDAAAVQTGSFVNGLDSIGAEAGQAASQTSQNNFINFCFGKTLTNGLQIVGGSCNGVVMGDIPAKTDMVSSIITFPQTGTTIPSDQTFTITVQTANLVAGSFTDADATYYAGPQFLQGGLVVGHTHVTVQDLGKSLNPTQALDATQFAFFKGINDAGNGQGLLSANVTGGLPAGNYRVCTMASASNHQPVLMPVAQRGTPDDCTKFVVTGSGTTINAAANNGAKGVAAAAAAADAVVGATNSAFAASVIASEKAAAAAATATSSSAAGGGKGGKNGGGANAQNQATTTAPAAETTAGGKGGKNGGGTNAQNQATTTAPTAETTAGGKGGKNGGVANAQNQATTIAPAAETTAGGKGVSKGGAKAAATATSTAGARHPKQRFARRQFVA